MFRAGCRVGTSVPGVIPPPRGISGGKRKNSLANPGASGNFIAHGRVEIAPGQLVVVARPEHLRRVGGQRSLPTALVSPAQPPRAPAAAPSVDRSRSPPPWTIAR